jgi:large subunit ribosomal protein L47
MKNMKHVLRERWYAYEDAKRMYESGVRPDSFTENTSKVEQVEQVEHPMSGEQPRAQANKE